MKIITRLAYFSIFLMILVAIVTYARGYRIDINNKSLTSTGILSISSSPKAAKVYINGELKGATDVNLTLPPATYNIEIKKDGYTSWNKKVNLKGEIVLSLDALLFPINPSLSPSTNLGIVKAVPVDQSGKILIFSQKEDALNDGLYLFESTNQPIPLIPPLKTILLKKYLPQETDFTEAQAYFSPDLKQAIIETKTASYIISLEEENKQLFDITNSKETLLTAWQDERDKQLKKILETFPKEIVKVASDSFSIISFSPDETKILYLSKRKTELPLGIKSSLIGTNQTEEERTLRANRLYVYDRKEDKNYPILKALNTSTIPVLWYQDSRHLIYNEAAEKPQSKRISIIDYDGENKQTIYSGPFDTSFFATTNDGKIVVLVNLNPDSNKLPDLYMVGIR